MNCPKCNGQLNAMGLADGVEVDFCSGCSGILFDAGEVAESTHLAQDIPALKDVSRAKVTGFLCPKCSKPWVEVPYLSGRDLMIDLCTGCGSIFLDKGEYPQLLQLAMVMDQPQSRIMRALKGMKEKGYEVMGVQKG